MKIKHKKIIGREFLILLSLGLVFGISFMGFFLYDLSIRSKMSEVSSEQSHVTKQLDSLYTLPWIASRLQNQQWFHESFEEEFDLSQLDVDSLWSVYEKLNSYDSITVKWNRNRETKVKSHLISIGFRSGEELSTFISENSLPEEIKNTRKKLKKAYVNLESEYRSLKWSRIGSDESAERSLIVTLILAIMLFILRPLIYANIWSIRVLRLPKESEK